ncbi:Transcription factor S-II, central domain containing protein [Coccidioides posadasii C735 delta SOWgp]|uniref:Transcription factor BYE1 n=1 Tax=Coccidioides posadasii (strain C735) TaxID=222929 RepID=C5PGQ3_COCP7|nr:Transcription factor S-II, central domain containing protein [Coccidioides posadasii C735 delta SOWgp]EER23706.1 Transcription factor S-II, central domain containing protein [Coccidioides posadasii C735 delta SOWgp]|eukprot:XP_003065851.1 Transcription factor S-II, central domain containing protein [Coccidioides posadasii C735 delta SOWgp]
MAEEPRRSGRATKGQHKNLDMPEPPPKRKGKSQTKAPKQTAEPTPPENEEDEIIRCICGEYEEEEDVERDMICCDKCSAWQHNDCMGLDFAKGEEPAEYYCEQCRPENHKVLLERMARGEKPWEEVAQKRAQAAEERKARRRKGGKRGRKSRVSDVKPETSDTTPRASAAPTQEPIQAVNEIQNGPPTNTGIQEQTTSSQKRKYSDHADTGQHEPEPKPKLQRLSVSGLPTVHPQEIKKSPAQSRKASMAGSPTTHGAKTSKSPTEATASGATTLTQARKNVANALIKLFVEQAGVAQEQGKFSIPEGRTKESVGEYLGFAIEQAMYQNLCGGSGEPNDPYRQQMRTILFNVRKNPSLRDSLLVGRITPDAFSKMSTQDMASEELRQRDDEIKREAERQHIIIQETGPRIRRTHKGEEFVESDPQFVGTESVFSTAPARRDTLGEAMSPRAASPATGRTGSMDAVQQNQKPQPIDTQVILTGRPGWSASDDFNIQNVWSSVQSPGAVPHHDPPQFGPTVFPQEHPPPSTHKVQADAEIDQLLKDEEPESPPYSPKDFPGPDIIWRGKVLMDGVASFSAGARFVGGADLSARIPWSQLVPPSLTIDGRIDIQLATNYVCGLRYSHTVDITVVAIPPPDAPDDVVSFNNLFDYFVRRKRYGVMGKHPLPAVKDTYLVPVEAGSGRKPEFMEILENNAIENPTPERLLLVVFVLKTSNNHSNAVTPQHPPATAASPLTATPTARYSQHSLSYQDTDRPSGSPSQSQGHYSPPPPYSQPQSPLVLNGKAAAVHVLGEQLASSPTIEEVLRHAPNADVAQFNVIAEILSRHPSAANSYEQLMNALMERTNGGT